MDQKAIFDQIKKEFCGLFSFNDHEWGLEVITPLATITDKFVSVFVFRRGDEWVVSDIGWTDEMIYGQPTVQKEDIEMIDLLRRQYMECYDIKSVQTDLPHIFHYYAKTDRFDLIPARVFSVANFVQGVVNVQTLKYKDEHEKQERDKFKGETNRLLKSVFQGNFEMKHQYSRDLLFDASVKVDGRLHLIEYITGSNVNRFNQKITESIVRFQLIKNRSGIDVAGKIALVNNLAGGYIPGYKGELLTALEKETGRPLLERRELNEHNAQRLIIQSL